MTRVRIGNQTAVACPDMLTPFHFALDNGFDAFEWFEDSKTTPTGRVGWDESDVSAETRQWLRTTGAARDVHFTVHAPWQANPLYAEGVQVLMRSLDFARDVGAGLVNLHLYMDEGPAGYVHGLATVARAASTMGLRLSIENTPHTTPGDFNRTFTELAELDGVAPGTLGMCLDIGHANLCGETHNDYVAYLDALGPQTPIVHIHAHENWGDADRHLTLFTGPSRTNDAGVRAVFGRLRRRGFRGVVILEQWPDPPQLLTAATTRLRALLAEDGPS